MNICILHGNELNNNSNKASEIIKKTICKYGDADFFEYYLPKDIPYLCHGCYECVTDTSIIEEGRCQFAEMTADTVESIKKADAIIICASVFSLASDGHIKSFLDHFAGKSTFNGKNAFKSALILSITPKGDIEPSVRGLADSLAKWGAQRVHYTSVIVWGKMWSGMPVEKQESCKETIVRKVELFYNSLSK